MEITWPNWKFVLDKKYRTVRSEKCLGVPDCNPEDHYEIIKTLIALDEYLFEKHKFTLARASFGPRGSLLKGTSHYVLTSMLITVPQLNYQETKRIKLDQLSDQMKRQMKAYLKVFDIPYSIQTEEEPDLKIKINDHFSLGF